MKKLSLSLLLLAVIQIANCKDKIESAGFRESATGWLFGVQLGGSSLLASPAHYEFNMLYFSDPKQNPNYKKQITAGWSLGGDAYYFFSRYFGLGVNYSFSTFSPSNEFAMLSFISASEYLYVKLDQKQFVHFLGPSAISRQWLNKNQNLQLTETVSAGYLHYRDELRIDSYTSSYFHYYRALVESNTWAVKAGISLNYYFMPWLSVGANLGFTYARPDKVDITTHSTGKKITTPIELDNQAISLLNYSFNVCFHIFD